VVVGGVRAVEARIPPPWSRRLTVGRMSSSQILGSNRARVRVRVRALRQTQNCTFSCS